MMNIEGYIEKYKQERQGLSFALLAERLPMSEDAPYRFNKAELLNPDDVLILGLAGKGYIGNNNIRDYNGYLKMINMIKQEPELEDKNIRSVVAVCNFGDYHDPDYARELHFLEYIAKGKYNDAINLMSDIQRQELLNPAYIKDIFEEAVLPRISADDGKSRLSLDKALYRIRRLNIVAHCHGGYVAFKLEQMMQDKMMQLGYSLKERQQIQKQLLILNYAPDSLWYKQYSHCVAVESANDDANKYQSTFKEWLQMRRKKFGFFFSSENLLMCTKIDKHGVEGNPAKTIKLIPVSENFLEERWKQVQKARKEDKLEPKAVKEMGEHSFLGFEPINNMSKAALKVQNFAKNILVSALLNSFEQKQGEKFKSLPNTFQLAARTSQDKAVLTKAKVVKAILANQFVFENVIPQKKKQLNAFMYQHQNNRLRLD